MPGRGRQTFNKRLKEQQRKERQQEKFAKRQERKLHKETEHSTEPVIDTETGEEQSGISVPLSPEEQA